MRSLLEEAHYMRLRSLSVLGAGVVLVASACNSGSPATTAPSKAPGTSAAASQAAGTPAASQAAGKTIKIGTELPMSGGEAANGVPTQNGVKLAIEQANAANMLPGWTLDINGQDDAVNGVHDSAQGGKNMTTLVNDPTVVGEVGPFNSGVAQVEIPIANAAGLLMCSPANTNTSLTYLPDATAVPDDQPGQDRLCPPGRS